MRGHAGWFCANGKHIVTDGAVPMEFNEKVDGLTTAYCPEHLPMTEERKYRLCERCGTDVAHVGLMVPFDREGNPHFHWDEWNITQD